MAVPSIIEDTEFEAAQMLLKAHSPAPSAPHVGRRCRADPDRLRRMRFYAFECWRSLIGCLSQRRRYRAYDRAAGDVAV
jgi:hypothetical protein